jgi:hypothetical protein
MEPLPGALLACDGVSSSTSLVSRFSALVRAPRKHSPPPSAPPYEHDPFVRARVPPHELAPPVRDAAAGSKRRWGGAEEVVGSGGSRGGSAPPPRDAAAGGQEETEKSRGGSWG